MLRQPIRIAEGLELDASEAATKTWGVLAFKGYGKTYLGGKLVEELYSAGAQQLILDEVGNWHGLRTSADGQGPGLSIPVLGGLRADLDLDAEQGERLAELLVETGGSAVIDTSLWRKGARRKFNTAFLETLYLQAKHKPRVRTLVCEEAQNIAPQMSKGDERMLGAAIDCVRLGRNVGLGTVLLTQRPASVSKECLNMADPLMVGRMLGTQERKAISEWVKHVGADVKAELSELHTLAKGEFFLWSPWLGKFERVKILAKRTLDASSTPTLDTDDLDHSTGRPVVAPADGDLLKELTAGLSPKAQEQVVEKLQPRKLALEEICDPQELVDEKELEGLRNEAAELQEWKRGAEVQADTIKALEAEVKRQASLLAQACSLLDEAAQVLRQSVKATREAFAESLPFTPPTGRHPVRDVYPMPDPPPAPEQIPRGNGKGAVPFGKAERAIMTVLVQHRTLVRLARLAALAGYHQKTKTFTNSLSSLSAGGFLNRLVGGFEATERGRKAFGHVPALPKGAELKRHYQAALGKAGRLILDQLWDLGSTNGHTRELLAQRCGYHEKTKAFTNELSKLRSMGLVEKQGVFYRVAPGMR